jgi:hypothetical protein
LFRSIVGQEEEEEEEEEENDPSNMPSLHNKDFVITADDIQKLSMEMGEPVDIKYAMRMLQYIQQQVHGTNHEQRKGKDENTDSTSATAELCLNDFCTFMSPPEP